MRLFRILFGSMLAVLAFAGLAFSPAYASELHSTSMSTSHSTLSMTHQQTDPCDWQIMAGASNDLRGKGFLTIDLEEQAYPCDQHQVRIYACLTTPSNNIYSDFTLWLEFYENSSYLPPSDHLYFPNTTGETNGLCGTGRAFSVPSGTNVTGVVEVIAAPTTSPTYIGGYWVEDRF